MIADEIREHAPDFVLARGHDGGMGHRQPQRMAKQGGDREPVRQRADEPGFGERLDQAQPRVARQKQARGDDNAAMATSSPVAIQRIRARRRAMTASAAFIAMRLRSPPGRPPPPAGGSAHCGSVGR